MMVIQDKFLLFDASMASVECSTAAKCIKNDQGSIRKINGLSILDQIFLVERVGEQAEGE